MDSFKFETGRTLENVEVEYKTYGMPKYDDEGNIINAILVFSTFTDEYSFLRNSHKYIQKNSDFDDEEFYFINITSLGFPNSCSPSTTGLKHNFPIYTQKDVVNFKRQFLKEKFKIKHILGLIGEGMGGIEIFTWACEYPEDMEFIFILNSSYKISGYKYLILKCCENITDITDDYYSDIYSTSLSKTLIALNTVVFAHSSSKDVFNNLDTQEIDAILDDFIEKGLSTDIYDLKYFNDSLQLFDVEDKLSLIKAKTLVVGNNKNFFDYEIDLLPLKETIKDITILTRKSEQKGYYFEEENYMSLGKEVIEFLEQFKK